MAFTGRDIAKFVSQVTGDNYLGLYDEAETQDGMMKTEIQHKFNDMLKRMNEVDKHNKKDIIE